jgi:hypothetical protein
MSVLAGSSNQARERRAGRWGFEAVMDAISDKNYAKGTIWAHAAIWI